MKSQFFIVLCISICTSFAWAGLFENINFKIDEIISNTNFEILKNAPKTPADLGLGSESGTLLATDPNPYGNTGDVTEATASSDCIPPQSQVLSCDIYAEKPLQINACIITDPPEIIKPKVLAKPTGDVKAATKSSAIETSTDSTSAPEKNSEQKKQ